VYKLSMVKDLHFPFQKYPLIKLQNVGDRNIH